MLKLGVLDQSPVPEGSSAGEALANTVELAQRAEQLGYSRYWLAEHHNTAGLAGSAPEILIAHVAAATSHIRVGSGGVMLPHYSPLKVAESFRLLHALHPGRIDLGLGRAPGSDQLTARALQRNRSLPQSDDFPQQLAELVAFLSDGFDAAHPFSRITARPATAGGPELWLLGSSGYSGAYAAHLGVGFSFAHFINPGPGPEVVQFYRDNFQPSQVDGQPRASAAISVICADSDDEAERLAASVGLWRLRLEGGDPGPVPTVERALAHPYTESDRRRMEASRGRSVVGGPERVRKELEAMAEAYGIDELIVVTIVHDHEARLRSYQLLAEAFALDS